MLLADQLAQARAARARRLAGEHAAAAEMLEFYARLCELQPALLRRHARPVASQPEPASGLQASIDREGIVSAIAELLVWLRSQAPPQLAMAARKAQLEPPDRWPAILEDYLSTDGTDERALTPRAFIVEAAAQPFALLAAERCGRAPADGGAGGSARCPCCGQRPLLARLREEGHGARRSFECGLCSTEWPAPRLGCTACGEARFERLPVFRADELPGVRVDACDACHSYLKSIDLTRDAAAVPVVDDLASLTLDLWAREQGYRRARPQLLRV